MKQLIFLAAVLLLAGCSTTKALAPLRIVCIGDSLTACGGPGGRYTDWLAVWMPETEIINKGIGGNTLAQGRARYQTDVMDLKPDVIVIELGACDFWRAPRPMDELASELEYMVGTARHAGMGVVIASCFGDVGQGDPSPEFVDERRSKYGLEIARFERQLAERYGCVYVPNMQIDIKPVVKHPQYWGDDRHPNKEGNERIARRIFEAITTVVKPGR
jgi:lysophospholipase L1-like esterase